MKRIILFTILVMIFSVNAFADEFFYGHWQLQKNSQINIYIDDGSMTMQMGTRVKTNQITVLEKGQNASGQPYVIFDSPQEKTDMKMTLVNQGVMETIELKNDGTTKMPGVLIYIDDLRKPNQ